DDKKEADKIRKEAKKKCDEEQQAKEQEKRRWATVVYRGKVYKRPKNQRKCKLPPGWEHDFKAIIAVTANPDHVGVPQPHAPRQRPALPPLKRGQRPTKKDVLDAITKNGMVEYLEE
ncbi:hypothetical protein AAVH_39895, partial [Aphelenchoides avenae]